MADAIRTAPREDRVLCGPAIMFTIAEEINLLLLTIVREWR
jgi:hypothetical protein